MALYIPHSIFRLARLLYVRPETFWPYYVCFWYQNPGEGWHRSILSHFKPQWIIKLSGKWFEIKLFSGYRIIKLIKVRKVRTYVPWLMFIRSFIYRHFHTTLRVTNWKSFTTSKTFRCILTSSSGGSPSNCKFFTTHQMILKICELFIIISQFSKYMFTIFYFLFLILFSFF